MSPSVEKDTGSSPATIIKNNIISKERELKKKN